MTKIECINSQFFYISFWSLILIISKSDNQQIVSGSIILKLAEQSYYKDFKNTKKFNDIKTSKAAKTSMILTTMPTQIQETKLRPKSNSTRHRKLKSGNIQYKRHATLFTFNLNAVQPQLVLLCVMQELIYCQF